MRILITFVMALAFWPEVSAQAPTRDLSGPWEITIIRFGTPDTGRVQLTVAGDKLTGQRGNIKLAGTVRGRAIEFQAEFPDGRLFGKFTGRVEQNEMAGEAILFGDQTVQWTARRPVTRPADAPRVHPFEPKEFHRYFSAMIAPALRIFPGDTVQTKSVDAGGMDENNVRRSLGGNPLTGPFYIEGALPGDTLAVRFNRIRLNRDTAISNGAIAAHALDPNYVRGLKRVENFDSTWKLDRERGVATLAKPTERLKNFTVKVQPMMGCVGVAPPANQSFLSGNLGRYGGNMDYNQIREGTTVYLPVFHPGALLYIGDGHAVQGDGELTGDALETSMAFEFTVQVIEGKSSGMPRAENDEYLMAIGIAGSLTDALQQATTGLARWLEEEYQLNAAEVASVLGPSIRYDIAEVVDPHVNVVAKISKSVLAPLSKPGK